MSRFNVFMLASTYLIYTILWDCGIIAGVTYLVFWMGQSGWWYLLALSMAETSYKPYQWNALITGKEPITKSKVQEKP